MSSSGDGRVFPRWLVALAVIVGVGLLLYTLRGALTPVFFAFLIAYMLDPLVDRFEARGISRGVGIAVVLTVVLGAMAVFMLLAVPALVAEAVVFARDVPVKLDGLIASAQPLLERAGIPVPHTFDEAREHLAQVDTSQLAQKAASQVWVVVRWLLGGTVNVIAALAGFIMIPVFAAYLLYDFDRMTAAIGDLVPRRYRAFVVEVAHEVDQVLGDFIRGQLLVMLALAVLYSVGYAVVGVRLAIAIGVMAGLLSFIPYVGGALALVMALLMVVLHWNGWGQLLGVVGVYTVIQLLESFLITPKIVGDKVGLPAVWVLFALLVGGELFGFFGVLLALPAAAVMKIFVIRGVAWYRASDLYKGEVEPGADGAKASEPPPDFPPPAARATDDDDASDDDGEANDGDDDA